MSIVNNCKCRCGGVFVMRGRSTPQGYRGRMVITHLAASQPGDVLIARTSGSADIWTSASTVTIDATGLITTPSGGFEVRGPGANDPIPDGCAVFTLTYSCEGPGCPCIGYMKVVMNSPNPGDVSLEFLNDPPTPCS